MNKHLPLIIFAVVIMGLVIFFGAYTPRTEEAARGVLSQFQVGNAEFAVLIAQSFEAQTLGLSGRAVLPAGQGMLFIFSEPATYGFWMRGMQFPLDFVWIRDNRVVGVTEGAPPYGGVGEPEIYFPPEPVDVVLEINAGDVARFDIKADDAADFVDAD